MGGVTEEHSNGLRPDLITAKTPSLIEVDTVHLMELYELSRRWLTTETRRSCIMYPILLSLPT